MEALAKEIVETATTRKTIQTWFDEPGRIG